MEGALGEEAKGCLVVGDNVEDAISCCLGFSYLAFEELLGKGTRSNRLAEDAKAISDFNTFLDFAAIDFVEFVGVSLEGSGNFLGDFEAVLVADGWKG